MGTRRAISPHRRAVLGAGFTALGTALWTPQPARAAREPTVLADELYPREFRLKPLAADPVVRVRAPSHRSAGLHAPSWTDPTYGTRIHQVTAASDYPGATFVRHNYSRRQAFNADNSFFIAQTSNGHWLLYDAHRFSVIRRGGPDGALRQMAGDAEALWHPSDPSKLWFTNYGGGLIWWEKDVQTDMDRVMVDFRGRLPWPAAKAVWTKGEGCASANGRFFAFMATAYDETTKQVTVYGLLSYDRVEDRIVGTLDAAAFGRLMPDHVSISPSGRFVVPSWAYQPTYGTRAYVLDFSSHRQLHTESEHSDLAFGPQGQDLYVHTNYKDGMVWAKDMATGAGFTLMSLYPRRGANVGAMHLSGKAFDRPGWVVISTYADSADHGKTQPDPVLQAGQRKIMLLELKPKGRQFSIAHTQTGSAYGGYFGEPQATVSRDGTRILFASNFNSGGPPNSYLVVLPSWVYN